MGTIRKIKVGQSLHEVNDARIGSVVGTATEATAPYDVPSVGRVSELLDAKASRLDELEDVCIIRYGDTPDVIDPAMEEAIESGKTIFALKDGHLYFFEGGLPSDWRFTRYGDGVGYRLWFAPGIVGGWEEYEYDAVTGVTLNGAAVPVTDKVAELTLTASDDGDGNVVTGVSINGNNVNVTKGTVDVSDREAVANKVTALSGESTDVQYPSAKAVWDMIGDVESVLDEIIAGRENIAAQLAEI